MRRPLVPSLLFLGAVVSLASPAHALKDGVARQEVEELRNRLNDVESSLQVRQMGIGEQLQSLREELARLEAKADENRRQTKVLGRQIELLKLEGQENLMQFTRLQQERFALIDTNAARLAQLIEGLQKNILALSDNLNSMADFEKKQEVKIGQIQTQFQGQLQAMVEEVGKENQRLQGAIASLEGDIAQFQGYLNTVNSQLQEVAARQEALEKAAVRVGSTHTVRRGETLSVIAKRYGVSVEHILERNNITDPNLIREGQQLIIPGQ